jgi:hypothetical protein
MNNDDYFDSYARSNRFNVNYGVGVIDHRPVAKFGGLDVIVSDQVKDGEALVIGGKAIMSHSSFDELRAQFAKLGATATDTAAAFAKLSTTISNKMDEQLYGALRGTALDTHPEQTEMEESPLWGAF